MVNSQLLSTVKRRSEPRCLQLPTNLNHAGQIPYQRVQTVQLNWCSTHGGAAHDLRSPIGLRDDQNGQGSIGPVLR